MANGTRLAIVISMVASGMGVTLLPTLAVRSEVRINNLRVRRFADTEAARTIGLVWRKKSSRQEQRVKKQRVTH